MKPAFSCLEFEQQGSGDERVARSVPAQNTPAIEGDACACKCHSLNASAGSLALSALLWRFAVASLLSHAGQRWRRALSRLDFRFHRLCR